MDKKAKKVRKALFKKLRDEGYTILVPDMCPIQFSLLISVFERAGYKCKVVTPVGREPKDEGLRSIQNDACYPALVTVGCFMAELRTGKYDLNKTAVIMSQTGGGCRASNYIALMKKAFEKEFPTVPVLSFNFSGLEKESSIPLTPSMAVDLYYSVLYGDFLMNLVNQALPYHGHEKVDAALNTCLGELKKQIASKKGFHKLKKNYAFILENFKDLNPPKKRKPRVGIVGEIFVKYSPYANNYLDEFLLSQGAEVVYPALAEFVLYCVYNLINDHTYYGMNKGLLPIYRFAYKFALKKGEEASRALEGTSFLPFEDFLTVLNNAPRVIDTGVKMGEGWLIPAEMLTFAEHGVENIVCAQPFGCLPNHIVGKGMVRAVKKLAPNANIVPLDFDASSTKVNQENRLKLMLSNIDREE